jgi:GT2 family glycosyltransferase
MNENARQPLVSIVIPCYNCEKWVSKTIDSCLGQTYPNIEIIVVDDGSTDGSLNVLRRFLPRITLETGPNRGGNPARNKGFALSKGEYIQYLDADDYLEPDKISGQVQCLEETKADVVYSDWRHQIHISGGRSSYLGKIHVSGYQPDILATMLSDLWVNGGAILYRRRVVEEVGGWDESLLAAQDRDFFTSTALAGADIRYQPGCTFIYRQHGAVTVSSSSRSRWIENHSASLKKSEAALAGTGRLTEKYKDALAAGYFDLARAPLGFGKTTSMTTYAHQLDELADKILNLDPDFTPSGETGGFMLLQSLLGLRSAMKLSFSIRSAVHVVRSQVKKTFLLGLALRMRGVPLLAE